MSHRRMQKACICAQDSSPVCLRLSGVDAVGFSRQRQRRPSVTETEISCTERGAVIFIHTKCFKDESENSTMIKHSIRN